jgi:hypothetical protein
MTLRHFSFTRRPVSEPPPEGMICFADNGRENGWSDRAVAVLTDGKWTNGKGKPPRFEPTYWIELEGMRK